MQQLQQPQKQGKAANGELGSKKRSRPEKTSSGKQSNGSTFDPMKYMLKLPKNKKVKLANGQVKWEQVETDYLPVAPRIAWFRKEHPYWSIVTEVEQLADKAVIMKATIRDMTGSVIATAQKKRPRPAFPIT